MHIRSGRDGRGVDYRPFQTYQLPRLVPSTDEDGNPIRAEIKRHGEELMADHQQYELRWPGWARDDSEHTRVWASLVERILSPETLATLWPTEMQQGDPLLDDLVRRNLLPKTLPEELAYHLAINDKSYPGVVVSGKVFGEDGHSNYGENMWAVAGLPADVARDVTYAVFALPEGLVPTLNYLKWLAEGHRHHPLFGYEVPGLDTMRRESLAEVAQTAASLYFRTLGDFLYRTDTKFWGRGPWKRWWPRFALYMHWVGRTGQGCYDSQAGLWDQKTGNYGVAGDYPDVAACMDAWNQGAMNTVRDMTGLGGGPPVDGPAL